MLLELMRSLGTGLAGFRADVEFTQSGRLESVPVLVALPADPRRTAPRSLQMVLLSIQQLFHRPVRINDRSSKYVSSIHGLFWGQYFPSQNEKL
jgi:hypothetical protein